VVKYTRLHLISDWPSRRQVVRYMRLHLSFHWPSRRHVVRYMRLHLNSHWLSRRHVATGKIYIITGGGSPSVVILTTKTCHGCQTTVVDPVLQNMNVSVTLSFSM
jgi:hypothetical protein